MNDGENDAGETRNDPEYGRRESGDSRAASASRRQRSNCHAPEASRDEEENIYCGTEEENLALPLDYSKIDPYGP